MAWGTYEDSGDYQQNIPSSFFKPLTKQCDHNKQVKQKEEKAKQEEVKKSSQHYVIDHLYYSIPVSDVPIRREQVILQQQVPSEIHSGHCCNPILQVRSRSTFVERARGINGVIRPPPSVFERVSTYTLEQGYSHFTALDNTPPLMRRPLIRRLTQT